MIQWGSSGHSNPNPNIWKEINAAFGLFHQLSPNILPLSPVAVADVISSQFRAAFNYSASHWPLAGLVVARAKAEALHRFP